MSRRMCWVMLVVGACRFDDQPPPLAVITCAVPSDCPAGNLCQAARCVSATRPVRNITVAPAAAKLGDVVTVTFGADFLDATEALLPLRAGALRASHETGALVPFEPASEGFGGTLRIDEGDPLREGAFDVLVDLSTTRGRTFLSVPLGAFTVDRITPRVVSAQVRALAGPQNLLVRVGLEGQVSAAAPDTTVTVQVEASEALSRSPGLTPSLLAEGLPDTRFVLDEAASSPSVVLFRAEVTRAPDGQWPLLFSTADLSGNRTSTRLPQQLRTDATPPPRPPVDTVGAIVLRREAAGGPDAGGQPRLTVSIAPSAVQAPGALVVFLAGIPLAGVALVPDAGSTLSFSRGRDEATVAVALVDGAGNRSALADVRDVEWVAWLGPQATPTSPHRAFPRGERRPELRAEPEVGGLTSVWPIDVTGGVRLSGRPFPGGSAGASRLWFDPLDARVKGTPFSGEGLVDTRGCGATDVIVRGVCVPFIPRWDDGGAFTPAQAPVFRPLEQDVVTVSFDGGTVRSRLSSDGGAVHEVLDAGPLPVSVALGYDFVRDEVLAFGGRAPDGGVVNDLWALRDGRWQALTPSRRPPARQGAWLLPAPSLAGTLLVGGTSPDGSFDDAWRYDGTDWAVVGDGGVPGATTWRSAAWDDARARLVLTTNTDCTVWTPTGGAQRSGPVPVTDDTQWACVRGRPPCLGLGSRGETWAWQGPTIALSGARGAVAGFAPSLAELDGTFFAVNDFGLYARAADPDAGAWSLVERRDTSPALSRLASAPDAGLFAATASGVVARRDGGWVTVFVSDAGVPSALLGAGDGLYVGLSTATGGSVRQLRSDGTVVFDPRTSPGGFRPVGLARDERRGSLVVLGELLIERTSGFEGERLGVLTLFDAGTAVGGGFVLERTWATDDVDSTAPPGPFGLTAASSQTALVATGRRGPLLLDLEARAAPEVVAFVDTTALWPTVPAGSVFQALRVRTVAGADGALAGQPRAGVDAFLFTDGVWLPVVPDEGPHRGAVATPAPLTVTVTPSPLLRRLTRPFQPLGVVFAGHRATVTDAARVSVDGIEVTLSYRRPP